MKKTSKIAKSPAPATRPVAKSAPKNLAVSAAKPRRVSATKTPPAPATTTISARIDVGFGNILYLRGEGPGLSWDKGVPLENRKSDHWVIALEGATRPIRFKFLVNDETWCNGEDFVAAHGGPATFEPLF